MANAVWAAASPLAETGFRPHIIIAHGGWGEALPLRSVFPKAKIILYCEYFYNLHGQDVDFDPELPGFGLDGATGLHSRNAGVLLSLAQADAGISPTAWQRATFPREMQGKIEVIHDGIDTEKLQADATASFALPGGRLLRKGQDVITFSARSLEPLRGYHAFMRGLPRVLQARPNAEVLIIGNTQHAYGAPAPPGTTWKEIFLSEVSAKLDLKRVHFLGSLAFDDYVRALQISAAHVYLTYPFVLSWSLLEAMSLECPLVASDCAPVREVLDNTVGRLVPFFDQERLSQAIVDVLANPAAAKARARAARQRVRSRYDFKSVTLPRLQQFLETLLHRAPCAESALN